mmetsp:Transcript_6872/g.12149  ORF Transcript_6872/g.12149 Transcript_6872/m.12149 type:complete len:522 (+) Transcript_6872:58-1623(+)|eukprot:CAMPEP_0197655510 /NCGR_PEP_ID=MMETSP1338-20131121/39493_1 /TAXON_ID=43686 ORGANISM="Pelagodinium beii, Strain RCC1491" /NCGR_SAMPLE_ID=MMETSP1338 /ASSEMBLY_ACC=CAM_ASM_000754 /LENGTH=521 /DNA_ID=CAMNT_0043231163 /DNA_START=47 /DNA_END=1612 /DNA_ORIENTATION=+
MPPKKRADDNLWADDANDGAAVGKTLAGLQVKWENFINEKLGRQKPEDKGDQKMKEIAAIMKTFDAGIVEEEEEEEPLWVDSPAFDVTLSAIILLNAFIIGLETDLRRGTDRHPLWWFAETVFLLCFMAEVFLKLYYHTWRWIFDSVSNILTVFICFMAFVDLAILNAIGASGVLRMFSMFRIVGISRLYKLIKKYRRLDELRLLLQSLKDSMQTLFWTVVLLVVVLYISAVIMTQQIGHSTEIYGDYRKISGGWDHEELFGTVGRSMFTLMQVMTLDSWLSKVVRHVAVNQWYMIAFFCVFLLITTFGIMNILVSVIVEQTLAASSQNKQRMRVREEKAQKAELDSIKEIFLISDTDGSNSLDLEEFLAAVKNPEVQWRMKMLELPIQETTKLFGVLDGDGSQSLSYNDFIQGCAKLKGVAMSKDMLAVMSQADALSVKMDIMDDALAESERMVAGLDEITLRITRRFDSAVLGSRRRMAQSAGGAKPIVPPKRDGPEGDDVPLNVGNRPNLPQFPDLLR